MAQTHSLDLERGSSQYASIADASQAGLDLTGNHTIEMWLKLESLPGTNETFDLVNKYQETGNNRGYMYRYVDVGGTKRFEVRFSTNGAGAGSVSVGTTDYILTTGVWYHIAFAYSTAGTVAVYVNGLLINTITSMKTSIFNNAAPFTVGNNLDGSPYDGLIKDVRVFSDIRTQSEIVADARTQNVSDANLVGEWNFNNAYTDSSGNNNTLTASGSPVFSTEVPWTAPAGIDGSTYLETNLLSYWNFENDLIDQVGSLDLSHSGTPSYGTGIRGDALSLGTGNEYASRAHDASMNFGTGNFAISFWAKLTDTTLDTTENVIRHYSSGGWVVQFKATNRIIQFYAGNGDNIASKANAIPNDTNWHHYLVTRVGSRRFIYVDGIQVTDTDPNTASDTNVSTTLYIGSNGASEDFDGLVDEVAMYNRGLGYGDVLDLWNTGLGIPFAGTQQFDQTISATVATTASILTPKTIVQAITANPTVSASIAMVKSLSQTLDATAIATASVLKGLAKTIEATASVTADMVATRAFLLTLSASVATSASIDKVLNYARTLEATASVTADITKQIATSVVLSATSTVTATIDLVRELVLTASVTTSATMTTAIGKSLDVVVSVTAKISAPFWRTKYPAHGDEDDYEIKYPHD